MHDALEEGERDGKKLGLRVKMRCGGRGHHLLRVGFPRIQKRFHAAGKDFISAAAREKNGRARRR